MDEAQRRAPAGDQRDGKEEREANAKRRPASPKAMGHGRDPFWRGDVRIPRSLIAHRPKRKGGQAPERPPALSTRDFARDVGPRLGTVDAYFTTVTDRTSRPCGAWMWTKYVPDATRRCVASRPFQGID